MRVPCQIVWSIVAVLLFEAAPCVGQAPVLKTDELLERLQSPEGLTWADRLDQSNDIAVYAYWKQLRRDVGRVGRRQNAFTAFVEGRTQTAVPDWWARVLRQGTVHESHCSFLGRKGDLVKHWVERDMFRLSGPSSMSIEDEILKLSWGADTVSIDRSLMRADEISVNRSSTVVAARRQDEVFLISDDLEAVTGGGDLWCVRIPDSTVKWRRSIPAKAFPNIGGAGQFEAFSEIVTTERHVAVATASAEGLSLNVFQGDGTLTLGFSTCLMDPAFFPSRR
ncbi:hypothetical protein VT03_31520 [Planctomyces sp. SH-PL14]|nr:hypothetical protein VT03_31520 [Planctomyces sp. SH-PL14]